MRVRNILERKGAEVVTTRPDATLRECLETLCERRIGAMPVLDDAGRLIGILSERDILRECHRLVSENRPAEEACSRTVRDAMTPDPITCGPDDPTQHVRALMTKHRIRHVPVVEDGRLCGIVSIGDVVLSSLLETEDENRALRGYIHATPI